MSEEQIQALLDRGEREGCINLSRFSEAIQELDLDEDELFSLHEQLDARGIELTDDCGQEDKNPCTYVNGDLVATDEGVPEQEVIVSLQEQALRKAVADLPEREREVVQLRYGLNGERDPKSLEAIAQQLGVTRERVRQIESAALERLAVNRELEAIGDAA